MTATSHREPAERLLHLDQMETCEGQKPSSVVRALSGDQLALPSTADFENRLGMAPGLLQSGDSGVDTVDNGFQTPAFALAGRVTCVVGG